VDHPCEGKGEPEGSKCVNVDGGFVCCPSEKAENECLEGGIFKLTFKY
jgi:hypothetical protein